MQPITVVVHRDVDAVAEDVLLVFILAEGIIVFDVHAELVARPEEIDGLAVGGAGQMRAFDGLHELAHALIVKALGIGQGMHGDLVFEAISAALHFLAHVPPLPRHPIGDVRKLRLPSSA